MAALSGMMRYGPSLAILFASSNEGDSVMAVFSF
jgi:hypothetical protein